LGSILALISNLSVKLKKKKVKKSSVNDQNKSDQLWYTTEGCIEHHWMRSQLADMELVHALLDLTRTLMWSRYTVLDPLRHAHIDPYYSTA